MVKHMIVALFCEKIKKKKKGKIKVNAMQPRFNDTPE